MKKIFYSLSAALTLPLSAQVPWSMPDGKIVQNGMAFGTCHATDRVPASSRYVFAIMDTRTPPAAFSDVNPDAAIDPSNPYLNLWNPASFHHPAWVHTNLGNVFGCTADSAKNFYIAAIGQAGGSGAGGLAGFGALGGYQAANPTSTASIAAGGAIYKIDAATGNPTLFATLPQQQLPSPIGDGIAIHAPGLGQIAYDNYHNQLFVSNFEDGKIYRLSMAGTVLDTFDPLTADNGAAGIAPIAERVWAVSIGHGGNRLYYSINAKSIRSVRISSAGAFDGDDRAEFTVAAGISGSGMPDGYVADIAFTADGAKMLVAERSLFTNPGYAYNHNGIAYQYNRQSGGNYTLNRSIQVGDDRECYGGGAWGPTSVNPITGVVTGVDQTLWFSSADILDGFGPHGLEAVPLSQLAFLASGTINGSDTSTSWYTAHRNHVYAIDYDGYYFYLDDTADTKGSGGDVDVFGGGLDGVPFNPPPCPQIVITPSVLPDGTVGTAYSQSLSASGGTPPYTWSATGLPTGLALNATTGQISGTPTVAGTATITVTDGAGCTATIRLTIDAASPCVVTAITVSAGACDNNGTPLNLTDDYYTASVTVTYANPPATGSLVLSGAALHSTNTVTTVAVGSLGSPTSHTFTGVRLIANGASLALTATFQ